MSNKYEINILLPFENNNFARIVYDVVRVDPEPKRNHLIKLIELEDNLIKVSFKSEDLKHLRVSIGHFFNQIILVSETINQEVPFQLTKLASYSHYNE